MRKEDRKMRPIFAAPLLVLAAAYWWTSHVARKHVAEQVEEIISSGVVPPGDFALLEWFSDWAPLDRVLTRGGANFVLGWGFELEKRLQVLKSMSYTLSIVVVWTIEDFRQSNVLSMASILPNIFLLISQFKGLGVIAPLYFFFHYIQSPPERYTTLESRLTNMAFVKTAFLTFLIVLIGPAIAIFNAESAFDLQWRYACLRFLYPVALAIMPRALMLCVKDTTPMDRLNNPIADLPYLRFTYGVCASLCAACYAYISFTSSFYFVDLVVMKAVNIILLVASGPATYAELLDYTALTTFAAAFYWIGLSFADLKVAGRLQTSWTRIGLVSGLSTVIAGPGAATLVMWAWREEIMAKKVVLDNQKHD